MAETTKRTYTKKTTAAPKETAETAAPAAEKTYTKAELDAMIAQLLTYKDNICRRMEVMSASHQEATTQGGTGTAQPAPKTPKITTLRRYDLCSVKRLQSKEDIDRYVDGIREKLMKTLEGCDGVQIN